MRVHAYLIPILIVASLSMSACTSRWSQFYSMGGMLMRTIVIPDRGSVFAPYNGSIAFSAASANVIALREFNDGYILTCYGDTLDRIWSKQIPVTGIAGPRRSALLCVDGTVVVIIGAAITNDSIVYKAHRFDAATGALLGEHEVARYHQSGSEMELGFAHFITAPDSSMFALYIFDHERLRRQGIVTFDAWAFTLACDTVYRHHAALPITSDEKDNEAPIGISANLDRKGRLLRLHYRYDSTLEAIRYDFLSSRADTLMLEIPGLDFDSEDGDLDIPILVVDSLDRLRVLGARRRSGGLFGNPNSVGITDMFAVIVFDFDRKRAEPAFLYHVQPDVVRDVIGYHKFESYKMINAVPLASGDYLFVLELQYVVKAHHQQPKFGYVSPSGNTTHYFYWDYALLVLGVDGHIKWHTAIMKRELGSVRLLADTVMVGGDSIQAAVRGQKIHACFRITDTSLVSRVFSTASDSRPISEVMLRFDDDLGEITKVHWLSATEAVIVTVKDRDLTEAQELELQSVDLLNMHSVDSRVPMLHKVRVPYP